jgi:hypothetical protein
MALKQTEFTEKITQLKESIQVFYLRLAFHKGCVFFSNSDDALGYVDLVGLPFDDVIRNIMDVFGNAIIEIVFFDNIPVGWTQCIAKMYPGIQVGFAPDCTNIFWRDPTIEDHQISSYVC